MSMDGLAIEGSQDGNRYVYHFHRTNSHSHSYFHSRGHAYHSSHSSCAPCTSVTRYHIGRRFRRTVE